MTIPCSTFGKYRQVAELKIAEARAAAKEGRSEVPIVVELNEFSLAALQKAHAKRERKQARNRQLAARR